MGQARIDFKAVKAAADFAVILARCGVVMERHGAELLGRCPFHDDHRPSFRVNPAKSGGVYHCFSCGAGGNVLDFVARKERLTIRQAAERIAEWCGLPLPSPARTAPAPRGALTPRAPETPPPPLEGENPPLRFTLKLDSSHPYLAERELDPATISHFGLGYAPRGLLAHRIAIPIHNERGELVAYAGRYANAAVPDGEAKYLLPPGFRKSEVLFNLHRVRDRDHLTLVEGYWSVFRLFQLGIPAVALMGSTLSPRQEELLTLSKVRRLTLFLDGDETGRAATTALLPVLAGGFFVRVVDFGPNTQPDTVPEGTLRRLIEKENERCP
jgi:DNA primase